MKALLVLAGMALLVLPAYAQSETLVVLHTEQGAFVIEFFEQDAPNHVSNFIELSGSGYYDTTLFHRIIPGFMIQGGDPKTALGSTAPQSEWGTGGPDQLLAAEFSNIMHDRGIVSMARSGHPDSAGSQFFIVHQDATFLDAQYTAFGRLATIDSYVTLDAIASSATDERDNPLEPDTVRITRAEVIDRSQADSLGYVLLDLGPPARTDLAPEETFSGTYRNEELNFRIDFPVGWVAQEFDQEGLPNVAGVGTQTGAIPPVIAVFAEPSNSTSLDDVIEAKLADLAAFEPTPTILEQRIVPINGRDAFILDATEDLTFGTEPVLIKHREITILTDGYIYTLLFSGDMPTFDMHEEFFEATVESFDILEPRPQDTAGPDAQQEGGGCLIATAAFGTELAPQIQQLRELRDNTLMQTEVGAYFVESFSTIYYTFSPAVADYERENPIFREMVGAAITPMIHSLSVLNHIEMSTEAHVVLYGIAAVLLVLASYLGGPLLGLYVYKSGRLPKLSAPA